MASVVNSKRLADKKDHEFLLDFVSWSDERKEEDRTIHREVLENYYGIPRNERRRNDGIRTNLKDPETFQMTETFLAKQLLAQMSDTGFVHAKPIGREDVFGGEIVNGLQESTFRAPGNFRAMYTGYKDTCLIGQTVFFPHWSFQEVDMVQRDTEIDPETGLEFISESVQPVTTADHVELMPIDFDDYYLEHDQDEIRKMEFGVRRFTIPAYRAMQMAEDGIWRKAAVKRAINRARSGGSNSSMNRQEEGDWRPDRSSNDRPFAAYDKLVGFEGYGNTPHLGPDKVRRRKIVVLNGELVMTRPMPLQVSRLVPFYEMVMNPVLGRFGGLAPAALARFLQSFADALLIALGRATIRQANPPVIVRRGSQVDMEAVKRWSGPIRALRVDDIKEVNWNPNLQEAFLLLNGLKQNMREQSGALGSVQGISFGQKQLRSASEAAFLGQQALDRPELISQLFEFEYLPALGLGIHELHQQFIEDSEDLGMRIGSTKLAELQQRAPNLDDIQGRWDIEFVGSRRARSKDLQLQFIERAMQVFGSIPGAAPLFPWGPALVEWLEKADMRKLEKLVADPQGVEDFIDRSQQVAGGAAAGNGNGAGVSLPPSGLAPAQVSGGQAI